MVNRHCAPRSGSMMLTIFVEYLQKSFRRKDDRARDVRMMVRNMVWSNLIAIQSC